MVSDCAFLFLLRLQDRWFARYLLFLLNTSNSIHETKLTSAVWFACLFTRSWLVTRSFSIDHVRAFDYFITSRHPKLVDGLYLAHENHWSDVRVDAQFIIPLFALQVCPNVHMAAIFPTSTKVVGLAKCPVRIQRRIRIIDPRKRFIGRSTEQSNPHKSCKKKEKSSIQWLIILLKGTIDLEAFLLFLGHDLLKNEAWNLNQKQNIPNKPQREYEIDFARKS